MADEADVKDLAKYARRVDKRATKKPRFQLRQINLRVTQVMKEELERRAAYLGMTRSGFIRYLLNYALTTKYGKAWVEYAKAMEKREAEG